VWPDVRISIRADSGFAVPSVYLPEGHKEPLRLARLLEGRHRLLQGFLAVSLQHGVHLQTDGVVQLQGFT
jgi:hypothetical protein